MPQVQVMTNRPGKHQSQALPVWSPGWREKQLDAISSQKFEWDLIVVGGGITGAGIYREAAGRGLRVLLLEQKDFAWGTSSRSSKMVHGGLRYLGSGQFGLARDSVRERQNLLRELPGLVDPLPFLMGHYHKQFPGPWVFDKLLAIYDWMAGKRYRQFIPGMASDCWAPGIEKQGLDGLTRFADAVTDDARLVLRVLHDGNEAGGTALNYVKVSKPLHRNGQVCGVELQDQISGMVCTVAAKAVVNATGVWTDTLRQALGQGRSIRPLRGSHLVVPYWRLPVAFSISFFHPEDKRPVFVFPWEGVTVVGTTDLDHREELSQEASMTVKEMEYLLCAANHQFVQAGLEVGDVISTWSGVRPVVSKDQDAEVDLAQKNDPSDEKREHVIWNDQGLLSVAGGKLTTYRLIALEVLRELIPLMPEKLNSRTLERPLPFVNYERRVRPRRRVANWARMLGRYGHYAPTVYASAGEAQGPPGDRVAWTDTHWSELVWACRFESVAHLDDLLLRRTRIGLLMGTSLGSELDRIRQICALHLGWDDERWSEELERYSTIMQRHYAVPSDEAERAEGAGL